MAALQGENSDVPTAAAPAPVVTGAGCEPGIGVTVVVDFAAADDANSEHVGLGCAEGEQATVAAAVDAAGFQLGDNGGFVCEIDGVLAEPTGCWSWPGAYWSLYTSTSNGSFPGETAATWIYANVGAFGSGRVAIDSAILWQIQPYEQDWENVSRAPRVPLSDLADHLPTAPVLEPTGRTEDGNALSAARWIGRQLQAAPDGIIERFEGWPDYGLTMDAVLALAAAGVGGELIHSTAEKIYQSGRAYLDPEYPSAGAIAKTALTLQVAGFDPTSFPDGEGTRNLIAELRDLMNPDGSFGASDFPFTHALDIWALQRTASGVPDAAVTWLQDAQCTAAEHENFGAYGYGGCSGVDVDGTAMSIQALRAAGVPATDPSVADAVDWISRQQQDDGGLPSGLGGVSNSNGAGLAAQALGGIDGTQEVVAGAARFVGALQVQCTDPQANGSPFSSADVGAIAYSQEGFADGVTGVEDQWRRATFQAILAFGLPSMDKITAAGADPELPADPCASSPPPSTPDTTTSPADTSAVEPTSTATDSSSNPTSRPQLDPTQPDPARPAPIRTTASEAATANTGTPVSTPVRTSSEVPAPVDPPGPGPVAAGSGGLAATGASSVMVPLVGVGLLLLAGGMALLFAGRRRTATGRHS